MNAFQRTIVNGLSDWFNAYRGTIYFLAKLIIAVGLLAYIISFIKLKEIFSAFENADLIYVFAALMLLVPNLYLQYAKWKISCGYVLNETNKKRIISSLFTGFSAGSFTPARIGEYFGRALAFKDSPLLKVTLATILDKLFLLFIVTFLGSVSSVLFLHFYSGVSFFVTIALFIVIFTLFYFITLLLINPRFWDNILFNKLSESKKLYSVLRHLSVLKNLDKLYAAKMMIYSLLFYLCFLLQFGFLVMAFSQKDQIMNYLWAGNLLMFAKTVIPPVSIGELGIREGASLYFLTEMGETASVAFNASITLFLINVLIPSLIGLIYLLKKNDK